MVAWLTDAKDEDFEETDDSDVDADDVDMYESDCGFEEEIDSVRKLSPNHISSFPL